MSAGGIESTVVLLTTVAAMAMLLAGFVPQRWLLAEFKLPMNGTVLKTIRPVEVFALVPKSQLSVFEKQIFTFEVISKVGLYINCKEVTGDLGGHKSTEHVCDKEGAVFWQKLSFGLAAAALLFGIVSTVMSVMGTCMKRYLKSIIFRFYIVVFNVLTACCALGPVIMYIRNRKIQVKPPLPLMVDFEPGWALYLTLATAGVFGLIFLMNVHLIVEMSRRYSQVDDTTNDSRKEISKSEDSRL